MNFIHQSSSLFSETPCTPFFVTIQRLKGRREYVRMSLATNVHKAIKGHIHELGLECLPLCCMEEMKCTDSRMKVHIPNTKQFISI